MEDKVDDQRQDGRSKIRPILIIGLLMQSAMHLQDFVRVCAENDQQLCRHEKIEHLGKLRLRAERCQEANNIHK